MVILGIGGVLGDAAAVLLKDGEIAAAVEEGKLTRRPPSGNLTEAAVEECLRITGIAPGKVDYVALARPLPPGSGIAVALRMFPNARWFRSTITQLTRLLRIWHRRSITRL